MSTSETVELLNTQEFKLAASGAGVIVCQQRSKHSFRALLSTRAKSVGLGLGITGGGFVEINDIFAKQPGYVIETVVEAWREATEENDGFAELFPLDDFLDRAQSIATMHARTSDVNGVHGTNFYALTVTDEEWERAAALKPGPERHGPLMEVWVEFTDKVIHRCQPEVGITLRMDDGKECQSGFYHLHEKRALAHIAWHVQQGLLWAPPAERKSL